MCFVATRVRLDELEGRGRASQGIECRALLVKLERRGLIELPAARPVSFEAGEQTRARPQERWLELKTTLQRLGRVELVVVNGCRAHSRVALDDEGAPPTG